MKLVKTDELHNKKLMLTFEWNGEEITKTCRPNDPHSRWMAEIAARCDLAKRLFGDKWRAKCGLLDLT